MPSMYKAILVATICTDILTQTNQTKVLSREKVYVVYLIISLASAFGGINTFRSSFSPCTKFEINVSISTCSSLYNCIPMVKTRKKHYRFQHFHKSCIHLIKPLVRVLHPKPIFCQSCIQNHLSVSPASKTTC